MLYFVSKALATGLDFCKKVRSGVSKEASPDQLKQFIMNKGITVTSIEKLTRDDAETRTNTFKIVIKLTDYEKAMCPEIWPYRVGIRHYRPPRRQPISWHQQANGQNIPYQPTTSQGNRQHVPSLPQNPSSSRQFNPSVRTREPSFNLDLHNRYDPLSGLNGEVFHTPN